TLAPAKPAMRYVYDGPESARDVRYLYHWDILRTALEKTRPKWGDYLMVASDVMTEQRQQLELMNATGKLNVMYLSTTPEFERKLIGIHIPVDRNLGGYCVFLIRDGEQARFANVRTLADLRKFSYGLGLGWVDVGILRANHFDVVTGSNYDGLFEMLEQKRFDVFLRAATEVLDEYEKQKGREKGLAIEKRILFYYPLPMYFWFPKTDEGRRLAARAEEGMRMMIADGTYDRIFDKYHRHEIETLRLKERKLFTIANPNVGPETPFADKKLLFDPQTYR
ncbi:MAG TPA: transporter substrate-binding domain-containing protein, partial [Thermoanaerobaculia bacterium]